METDDEEAFHSPAQSIAEAILTYDHDEDGDGGLGMEDRRPYATYEHPSAKYEIEKPVFTHPSAQYEVEKPDVPAPSTSTSQSQANLIRHQQYEQQQPKPQRNSQTHRPPSPISSLPSQSISIPPTPRNSQSSLHTPNRRRQPHQPLQPQQSQSPLQSPYFYPQAPPFQSLPTSPTRQPRDSGVSIPEDTRTVVLITGCSKGGIGYSLMLSMASRGCRVFGTVRDVKHIAELSATLHHVVLGSKGSIEIVPMDVTDGDSVRRAIGAVVMRAGKIDVLVNNAGVALSGPMVELDLDACRILFETNVVGLLGVVQEVVPHMIQRKAGKIVNLGSMVGYVSLPWSGAYCASKSAIRAITSSLRMELIPFGIQVSLVCAGTVRTNLIENMHKLIDAHPSRRSNTLYGPLKDRRIAMGLDAPLPSDPTQPPKPTSVGIASTRSGTDPDQFAETIAKEILHDPMPPSIMAGKWWWVILVFLWFPEAIIEYVLQWRFGLKAPAAAPVEKSEDSNVKVKDV
ncbi:hypothetical protein HDU97_004684 [Phlyctochytrium planicorne]|nr:hypothetical protein HDU97_004684 [Phlyctochytrium planicorne]